jgi:hypothetical protein
MQHNPEKATARQEVNQWAAKKKVQANNNNIQFIAQQALSCCANILSHWLPGGKNSGGEYVVRNPTRPDHDAGSFKINTKSGKWSDFATGDKGGDLVALVAFVDGIGQYDAAKKLATFMGIENNGVLSVPSVPKAPKPENIRDNKDKKPEAAACSDGVAGVPKVEWLAVMPIPPDAPAAPTHHPKQGKPTATWTYHDADGQRIFYVYRFDPPSKKKDFRPLSYCRNTKTGKCEWCWQRVKCPL